MLRILVFTFTSLLMFSQLQGDDALIAEKRILPGNGFAVFALAFSPDGKLLASGGGGYTLKLWDLTTGKERASLVGHFSIVDCVVFSPDGKLLVSGCCDCTIKIWDVESGKERATLEAGEENQIRTIAISPDGLLLAASESDGDVAIWEMKTGKKVKVLSGLGNTIRCVAFGPDGKLLAAGTGVYDEEQHACSIIVWNTSTWKGWAILRGHEDTVTYVTFDPTSRVLASCSWYGSIKLWEIASGKERATLIGHKTNGGDLYENGLAFSPDGRFLVSCSWWSEMAILWDVATGKKIQTLDGPYEVAAFSPDGTLLASPCPSGDIKLWDVRRLKNIGVGFKK